MGHYLFNKDIKPRKYFSQYFESVLKEDLAGHCQLSSWILLIAQKTNMWRQIDMDRRYTMQVSFHHPGSVMPNESFSAIPSNTTCTILLLMCSDLFGPDEAEHFARFYLSDILKWTVMTALTKVKSYEQSQKPSTPVCQLQSEKVSSCLQRHICWLLKVKHVCQVNVSCTCVGQEL